MLIPKIEGRINQYVNFLKANRYREIGKLKFDALETDKIFRKPPQGIAWKKAPTPYQYGKQWHTAWFRSTFKAPAKGAYPIYLRAVPNSDSLVFIDGKPAGAFNPYHKKLKINADGKEHTLHIEAYGGHTYPGAFPFDKPLTLFTLSFGLPNYPNTFEGACLLERIEPIYSLYYDVICLFELAKIQDNNSLRKARILKGLYDALMEIPFSSSGAELEKEAVAAAKKIAPLLALKNGPTTPEIHLVGHAHLDHAWLWPIMETERKAARTYMNMVRMGEEYPDFVFLQTQAAQLEIVKNEYPDVFAAVKEAYKRGNWEPNGGMWVEADCNITGGESLIRQFLVGKAAIKEMLDYEGDTLWLPDVFGYAAALPQILAGCRIKYFVTSKIAWNDTTRFPYDTFLWRGIDGTAVKTHYISSRKRGYNGKVSPEILAEIWSEIQHKEVQSAAINSVGEGDGGGGTIRSDLEMAKRLGNLEGVPKSGWTTVSNALNNIFKGDTEWPEWRGELYLELHRGTYTSQAKTKQYNRRLEFALRNTEFYAALAALDGGIAYPHEALLVCWKKLLTNQFHDIIPGSSIHRVYTDAAAEYQKIEASLGTINLKLRDRIQSAVGGGVLVFNDLSWEREDPVSFSEALPAKVSALQLDVGAAQGTVYPIQRYTDLSGKKRSVFSPKLPSLGWIHFVPADPAGETASPFSYKNDALETPFYKVRFDKSGRIISLVDKKRKRELIAPGGVFNRLVTAQDIPVAWEAWDVDSDWTKYITEETRLVSTETAADGPVCFRLRRTYQIGVASTLAQDSVFYAEEPRIDFETKVNWQEKETLLKTGFDTAIDATQVRCEVQYGHLLRNTHRNLPHDRAKFEVCAHKWVSLEEEGGGIALLNDSKYGHDFEGGRMRLTLLRSPIRPDESADIGEQWFTYSLLPFQGSFGEAAVVRKGYELNDAPVVVTADKIDGPVKDKGKAEFSFLSIEGSHVIAESIKAPEAKDAEPHSLVIRLYESLGGPERTVLHFSREIAGAYTTDMLESNPQRLKAAGTDLVLDFRAFEIKTVLITFR